MSRLRRIGSGALLDGRKLGDFATDGGCSAATVSECARFVPVLGFRRFEPRGPTPWEMRLVVCFLEA